MRNVVTAMICVAVLAFDSGCATTVVKPVRTGKEHGVRFYRPKPYLKIAPAGDSGKVTLELVYLPDFSEEYTAIARTGIGKNDTQIDLRENGTLQSLHSNTDSKFSENLTALAELMKAVPGLKAPAAAPAAPAPAAASAIEPVTVSAHKVPLGFYESVVSRDPECRKRLYGWRYVGFAPFANCPVESGGLYNTDCSERLYGLITVGDKLVFSPLDELASRPVQVPADPTK